MSFQTNEPKIISVSIGIAEVNVAEGQSMARLIFGEDEVEHIANGFSTTAARTEREVLIPGGSFRVTKRGSSTRV